MGEHRVFVGKVIPPSDESEGYRVEKVDLNTGESSGNDDIQEFLSRLNGEQVFVAISDVHHSFPQTASDLRSAIHWFEQNPRALRKELDEKERQVEIADVPCGELHYTLNYMKGFMLMAYGGAIMSNVGYIIADQPLMFFGGILTAFSFAILIADLYRKSRREEPPQSG